MREVERLLLETGCKYSTLAYEDKITKGIKIESRLTSTTAYVIKTKSIDIICFRGTAQLGDWLLMYLLFQFLMLVVCVMEVLWRLMRPYGGGLRSI